MFFLLLNVVIRVGVISLVFVVFVFLVAFLRFGVFRFSVLISTRKMV